MANQLDDFWNELGNYVWRQMCMLSIAKVIPVETSGLRKLLPTIPVAVGAIGNVLGMLVIDKYLVSIIAPLYWWSMVAIKTN